MPDGYPLNDPPTREARALSFGAAADIYDRSRPSYPAEAVRDVVGAGPADVLDLGAGTGKLTRVLVAEGHRVVVAEPDAGMLAQLRSVLPGVETHQASAESLPFPDATFDAVVVGQAAHWFDPEVAMPEIARVLRPGGRIGLFWNTRDESLPWVEEFGVLVGREDAAHDDENGGELGPSFGEPTVRRYRHRQTLDVDGLVDLAHSRSALLALPADERAERLAAVRELGLRASTDGVLELTYELVVWSAVRA